MANLRDVLLSHLSGEAHDEMSQIDDLEGQVRTLLESAEMAWPQLCLAAEVVLAYWAERLPSELPPAQRLSSLQVADLYLACACVRGDATAIELFESSYQREIKAALDRLTAPQAMREEILQALREQLVIGHQGGPPLLSRYSGRGRLAGWLRVTSVRAAIRMLDREMKEIPAAEEFLQGLPAREHDPELQYMQETYRDAFKQAFRNALVSLPARDRTLLQLHFLDQLSIDRLGALYRVHRSTAARWLEKALRALTERTRSALTDKLRIDQAEFNSIMRLFESHLDLTFRSLLIDDPPV